MSTEKMGMLQQENAGQQVPEPEAEHQFKESEDLLDSGTDRDSSGDAAEIEAAQEGAEQRLIADLRQLAETSEVEEFVTGKLALDAAARVPFLVSQYLQKAVQHDLGSERYNGERTSRSHQAAAQTLFRLGLIDGARLDDETKAESTME